MENEAAVPKKAGNNKPRKARGRVSVNIDRCKGCGFCVAFCPSDALEMSEGYNAKGYHYPELSHLEKCSGCDLCGMYCPDFAICGVRIPWSEAAEQAVKE